MGILTTSIAAAALLLSLWLLRLGNLASLDLQLGEAPSYGLLLGLLSDLLSVLCVALLASAAHLLHRGAALAVWLAGSAVLFAGTLSDSLYLKFFGDRLHVWIIQKHLSDVLVVGGSAGSLAGSWTTWVGLSLALSALGLHLWRFRLGAAAAAGGRWRALIGTGSAVLLLALLLAPIPFLRGAYEHRLRSTVLAENIFDIWIKELFSGENEVFRCATVVRANLTTVRAEVAALDVDESKRALAALRDFERETPVLEVDDRAWPQLRQLRPEPELQAGLRQRLGFEPDQRLNVIVLFLESSRAFELLHPELGPQIYPRTLRLLEQHALWFPQTYTASLDAGMTVRGQFSTLCSMLPNLAGPAPPVAYPAVRVTCLAQLFKAAGYRTTWFSGFDKSYHNKDAFESLHGTDEFYDQRYFASLGLTEKLGWGFTDIPVLEQTVRRLEELAADGRPVFANITTLSTHHPYTFTPLGQLPPDLMQATAEHEKYRAFLSLLRYTDQAVGAFFDALFASPLGDNTLVMVLGDHSTKIDPHLELSPLARKEMRFRTWMALVSKHNPAPARLDWPAHQMDVAPTVADIIGLQGRVGWLGRDVLQEPGSPMVFLGGTGLSYRTRDRVCYHGKEGAAADCHRLDPTLDPLFDALPESIEEDPALSGFFLDAIFATRQAIVMNFVEP